MPPTTNISSSSYHSVLRVTALIFAMVLVFESGLLSPVTQRTSHLAGQQLASVVTGTVDTALYSEGSQTRALGEEATFSTQSLREPISKSTFLLSVAVFILLLLIILNYILDYLRRREKTFVANKI
jgi:hypothetical protein